MGKGSVMAGIKRVPGGGARGRKKLGLVLGLVAGVVLAVTTYVSVAYAALPATVQGVTPRGTTINLFDYWVDTKDGVPQNNGNGSGNGINKDHALKFGGNNGGTINVYTSSAQPRSGIVQNHLVDGYPALNSALANSDESLAYLFNPDVEESSRATHANVGGLLQVDENGYYYYNSHDNFASYVDGENNNFVLYSEKAVNHGGTSPDGQFFPFNKGTDVFNDSGTAKNINSNNSVINHYFGLTMQTNFVQQYDGHVDEDEKQSVTYNFSGDDDVWVFIDGVLVGDLGGIHDATALQIDFSSGKVIIFDDNSAKIDQNGKKVPDPNDPNNGNNHYDEPDGDYKGETVYTQTTLKALFDAAHVDTSDFNGDTLPNNTYHTLSFFYMERGNVDSNMSLKYNLVNIPESGVMKVDAVGTPLNGVNFNLYPASSDFTITDESNPYTATTDSTGNLIFRHPDAGASQGTPIRLDELGNVSRYWVLRETNVPAGYRSNGDVQLRFAYGDDTTNTGNGPLLVSNQWDSGAYSEPHVTVQADSTVKGFNSTSYNLAEGTMFAVVEKKVDGGWLPVYGDPYEGWQFAKDESASSLAMAGARNIFTPGTSGAYEMTIENLPGDITTYEYMLKHHGGSANDAQYRVKYYYTEGNLTDANDQNTFEINPEVEGSQFVRVFSVTVNLTNPKNELTLVKTDEDGKPLANAEFTLYQADENGDVATDENGAITSDVVNTFTTNDSGEIDIANSSGMLPEGKYVLVETKAPEGYAPESTQIPIIVDDDGVHVNAGTADDNVTVTTSLGTLLYSMKGFAANDRVDATLHDITVQPQDSTEQEYPVSDESWQNVGMLAHMQYENDNDKVLNYAPTAGVANNGDGTYTADAGWSRLNIQQCMAHNKDSVKTDLSALEQPVSNLNHLFTGDVTINVTNHKPVTLSGKTALKVQKTVTGASTDTDFSFALTLQSGDAGAVYKGDAAAVAAGTSFGDGMTATITKALTNGTPQTASFGAISFTKTGTYKFEVKETTADPDPANGWTYDNDNARTITVTVGIDDESGDLEVTGVTYSNANALTEADRNVEGAAAFTNSYATGSIDYDALVDLQVAKTLNGRDMTNDQFSFTVTPNATDTTAAKDAADKLGIAEAGATVSTPAAEDGATAAVSLLNGKTVAFTQADAGKTFSYTVKENAPESDGNGYTYDRDVYTVEIAVSDNGDGTLSAVTTVSNGSDYKQSQTVSSASTESATITIPFVNFYEATTGHGDGSGAATVSATKSLTGRDLRAGEFSFAVAPRTANGLLDSVVTAKNAADGTVNFGSLGYTTADKGTNTLTSLQQAVADGYASEGVNDSGQRTWTLSYTAYEVTDGLPSDGVSANTSSVDFTVTVVDNGDGTLTATANLPEGGIAFTNTYSTGEPVSVTPSGSKSFVYADGEAAAPDFEGRFTFTLSSDDPTAPMPKGDGATATNDANGNVTFGTISFDLDDLAGVETAADGSRSKTFTYTVTESGSVDSVTNDAAATKTFTITLTDDGQGHLTAVADPASGPLFTFTNTYTPSGESSPTGEGGVKITKQLTGRDLRDGEFAFQMSGMSTPDGVDPSASVLTATNDANGNVSFDNVIFTKPGTYTYAISEIPGDLGGVTYDRSAYFATATVTDKGNGTLDVAWAFTDASGNEVKEITFANTYQIAQPTSVTLGASKVLNGRDLKDGEFSFELKDADGKVLQTAKNAADGSVVFDPIAYDELGGGAYTYTISEVLPEDDDPSTDGIQKDGVTYDETTYTVEVTVTDDGNGRLDVTGLTYNGEETLPVFTNSYTEPVEPTKPAEPTSPAPSKGTSDRGDKLMQTGDSSLTIVGVVLGVAVVAIVAGVALKKRG